MFDMVPDPFGYLAPQHETDRAARTRFDTLLPSLLAAGGLSMTVIALLMANA